MTGGNYSPEDCLFSFLENFLSRLKEDLILRRLLQRLLIDSKAVDLAAVSEYALLKPFTYVVDLLSRYKPRINAKIHIYSFFCSAIMGEDLRVIADLLSPELKEMPTSTALLEHFRGSV